MRKREVVIEWNGGKSYLGALHQGHIEPLALEAIVLEAALVGQPLLIDFLVQAGDNPHDLQIVSCHSPLGTVASFHHKTRDSSSHSVNALESHPGLAPCSFLLLSDSTHKQHSLVL